MKGLLGKGNSKVTQHTVTETLLSPMCKSKSWYQGNHMQGKVWIWLMSQVFPCKDLGGVSSGVWDSTEPGLRNQFLVKLLHVSFWEKRQKKL